MGQHEVHRRRVFSLSLGDWLDAEVPIEWLADMLDVIRRCPNLDFLLLTKRPQNFDKRIRATWDPESVNLADGWLRGNAPDNIWLGVSVENQATADERIPLLLQIPAKIRFVSYEPALEAVDFHLCKSGVQHRDDFTGNPDHTTWMDQVNWIIVGGESGRNARPFNIEWARSSMAQCKASGVACFVKQLGRYPIHRTNGVLDWPEVPLKDSHGGDMAQWPDDLRVREWPKVTQ